MAKVRSPNFPSTDLRTALGFARKAFDKDHRNKMSRAALAKHVGHESLSGPALTKLGTLRAYGIVEGNGDELRISDDAVAAMMAPEDSEERNAAVGRLAFRPAVFQEIRKEFSGLVSEDNLRYWLIKRQYTPDAAGKAAKAYLATMQLVNGDSGAYDAATTEDDGDEEPPPPKAEVGDLIQVEIGGAFQLEKPKRVRAIREDQGETWVFIEGSETGIPMSQVIVQEKGGGAPAKPPVTPPTLALEPANEGEGARLKGGEREWLRGPLSRETNYRLIVSGDLGPKEIGKLIKLLEAQKAVLADDDDDVSDMLK